MTDREKLDFAERKLEIYIGCEGICDVCGKHTKFNDCQLAHRIPQTKYNLRTYGKEVIHHEKNLALVCSLQCNGRVNIGHRPVAVKKLVEGIYGGTE